MFILSLIEHTLRLPPHLLNLPLQDALRKELENNFLDKVIRNLGLCVSIYDVRKIDGGFIFAGDGASTYTVGFRMVLFRPFVGEIIVAELKESNPEGLRLSLGFFDDIFIPSHCLPTSNHYVPDKYNRYKVIWSWDFETNDPNITFTIDELYIKFRVTGVEYPEAPLEQPERPFAPMVIQGTIDEDGLGPISWWCDADICI